MATLVTLTANDPAGSSITLLDGGSAGGVWEITDGVDWGDVVWEAQFSGARGTLGARVAASRVTNRSVRLPLRLSAGSVDLVATELANLLGVVEACRSHGGRVTARRHGQTYRQHLVVFDAQVASRRMWDPVTEARAFAEVDLRVTAAPYVEGDAMDWADTFDADSVAGYTMDTGAASDLTVAGGSVLTATSATVTMIAGGDRYHLVDNQVAVRFVPVTLSGMGVAAVLKRVAPDTLLLVDVVDDGSTSTLRVVTREAGTDTVRASQVLTRLVVGVPGWVVGRVEGDMVYAEWWASTNPPTLAGTATTVVAAFRLTGALATSFGRAASGWGGVRLAGAAGAVRVDEVVRRPYVYRGANFATHRSPGLWRLGGAVPGDAPARCTVEHALAAGGVAVGSAARWGLIGFAPAPTTHNLLADGSFEHDIAFQQWSHTAVSGVLANAGTSITRTAGGRFGGWCGQVVAPATANSGARTRIHHRFQAGVTYTARVWVRAASATTNLRIRLGVSGDIASETASALSAGWVLRTVTWTPSTTVDLAWLVVEITAATATTFQVDGCCVFEGTTPPTSVRVEGHGGRPPFGVVPAVDRAGTNGTVDLAAGSAYLDGTRLTFTSATATGDVEFLIDPDLLPADAHAESSAVEVYLMAHVPTAVQTTLVASTGPVGSGYSLPETYTAEHGEQGVTVTTGTPNNFHVFALGTVHFPVSGSAPHAPVRLRIRQTYAVAQTFHWDHVLLVPAGARACSPSGVATLDGYPVFAQTTQTAAAVRRFTDDLRGYAQSVGASFWTVAPTLEGPLLTPGPGVVHAVTGFSGNVPGGGVHSSAPNGHRTAALAVTPTPRWHYWRDT